jgi:hypothetical protein
MTHLAIRLAAGSLLLVLAACAGGEAAATPTAEATPTAATATSSPVTPTPEIAPATGGAPITGPAPIHALPADAQVVWGTADCGFSDDGVDPEGGAGLLVICDLAMSDPRVSGTERIDRFRFVADGPGGAAWIAEEDAITNKDGAWRGSAQAAEDGEGIPAGEAHFTGAGAYEGLEFHYYFFHASLDEPAQLNGWISPVATDNVASSAAGSAPFHAVPGDATVVSGTATCEFLEGGVDTEGGEGWLVVCPLDLSDPRVAGTERQDRFRFVVGRIGAGDVWVAEEATITTPDGAWHGTAQGAEDDEAVPIGEAHYVGEGAYEGLEFHYYFAHLDIAEDGPTQLRGWISGGG